jgi:hypothetical protein
MNQLIKDFDGIRAMKCLSGEYEKTIMWLGKFKSINVILL